MRVLRWMALLLTLLVSPAQAKDTLFILIPVGPGSISDVYARLLQRHLGKYFPQETEIVIQNMPGAGGAKLCNYLLTPLAGSEKIALLSPGIGAKLLGDAAFASCTLEKLVDLGAGDEGGRLLLFRRAVGVEHPEDL